MRSRLGGSRSRICLCVRICECVSKYHIEKNRSKDQGGPSEEISNILLWGAVRCIYSYYSHILDRLYTRIVWGFQFSIMDHAIVVPGFGGTVSRYHARPPT